MVAVPEAFNTIVWLLPPLMVYVMIAFGVPVKVITVVLPVQIAVEPEIVGVGNAFTVTTAEPVWAWLHVPEATLTKA